MNHNSSQSNSISCVRGGSVGITKKPSCVRIGMSTYARQRSRYIPTSSPPLAPLQQLVPREIESEPVGRADREKEETVEQRNEKEEKIEGAKLGLERKEISSEQVSGTSRS